MGYTFKELEKNKEVKLCQLVYENGEFVAQTEDSDPQTLNDDIQARLEELLTPSDRVRVGQELICQFVKGDDADDRWYRAQVTIVTRGGQVAVEFVDYGNDQIYAKDKWQEHCRHPLMSFREKPIMCIRMVDEKLLESEDDDLIDRLIQDDENKFTFVPSENCNEQVYEPELTKAKGEIRINGRSLAEKIESMKLEMISKEEDAVSNLSLAPSSSSSTATVKSSTGTIQKQARKMFKVRPSLELKSVTISEIDDEFIWIQRNDKIKEQADFDAKIDNEAVGNEILPKTECIKNALCLAKFQDSYYRGFIVDTHETDCTVLFVDYGNRDRVDYDQIRRLPDDIRKTQSTFAMALLYNQSERAQYENVKEIEGRLKFLSKDGNKKDHETYPMRVIEGQLYLATSDDQTNTDEMEKIPKPEVKKDDLPFKVLREEKVIVPDMEGTDSDFFVSQCQPNHDLYLCKCEDYQEREDFSQELNEKIKAERSAESIKPGEFYGAEFEGAYYRCEVINYVDKVEDNMVEVLFCDYGNFETVNISQIRNLPTDMNRPKFAIKVSISPGDILDRNRDQLQSWENEEDPKIQLHGDSIKIKGENLEKYFEEEILEAQPQPDKPRAEMPKVHNGYTQHNIGDEADMVVIEHEKTELRGYLKSDEDRLIEISNSLEADIDQNFNQDEYIIEVGDTVAVYFDIFDNGKEYLRGQILSHDETSFNVKLVDYGITRRVDKVYPLDTNHAGPGWECGGLQMISSALTEETYLEAVTEVDGQNIVKVRFGPKESGGKYEFDFANQNEAVVVTNQNQEAEEKWEPLTVVVTNLRQSGDHYHVTCFRDSDWPKLASLESETPANIDQLEKGDHVLLKTNPLNKLDHGFRRGILNEKSKLSIFHVPDCDKRLSVSASAVYQMGDDFELTPLKLTFDTDPGRDIIGRTVNVMVNSENHAKFDYSINSAKLLIDHLCELPLDSLDEGTLNSLIHRLQATIELF